MFTILLNWIYCNPNKYNYCNEKFFDIFREIGGLQLQRTNHVLQHDKKRRWIRNPKKPRRPQIILPVFQVRELSPKIKDGRAYRVSQYSIHYVIFV